jgi:hypothetical protein
MRIARFLPILAALPVAGCLLTNGQFLVEFGLPDPIAVTSPLSVVALPIDLNTVDVYNDHKEEISDVSDVALLGVLENTGSVPLPVEFWMTAALTNLTSASAVRSDPTASLVWGPLTLAPGEVRRIAWDESAGLFSGRAALLAEVKGDGVFTLYGLGPSGATTYSFRLDDGVVVVTIDAGV